MENNDIFLSVLVPCYNIQDYVEDCLLSLKAAKEQNVEFIIINDGSKDHTLEKIRKTINGDDRFVLINQENKGVSSARNVALRNARGKYVYLLDGDDCLVQNALSMISDALSNNDSDLLISSFIKKKSLGEFKREHGIVPGIYSNLSFFESIRFFPTSSQIVYRMEIIRKNNLRFDENIKAGEVYSFTIKFLRFSNLIQVVSEPSFYYVMRDSSAVHSVNFYSDFTVLKALESIYKNGGDVLGKISFHITAFKLVTSFTYTKYVKNSVYDENAVNVVKEILGNKIFRQCLVNVSFRLHSCLRERFYALYILLFSVHGFKLLKYIRKFKL